MSSFFTELKRRNVFKVGVAYVIISWLLIQVTDIVAPALHLPDWTLTFIVYLLVIGFPLALFLAWAFELTPEGIKPTQSVDTDESITSRTGQKLNYIIIGLMALAIVLLLVDDYLPGYKDSDETGVRSEENVVDEASTRASTPDTYEETVVAAPASNTIAVLPFTDISPDRDQEYFADGLTEELLNKLAQVKGLQVTARTSSFYFKDRNEDMRTIGETLGVAYLLEGSVRKAGDQLRITTQLIKAQDGYHLWSETYDRELADIFSVQDEIAQAVTTALSITLGAGEFDRPGMTRNIKAYEEYLRGIANAYKYTPDSILAAVDQMERAVDIDPDFAGGWLALRSVLASGMDLLSPAQTVGYRSRMAEALQHALAIAPDMPALLSISAVDHQQNGNWLAAEDIWQELLEEYGHSDAGINSSYGQMLIMVGREADAIPYIQRAKRLNPLDSAISFYLAAALLNANRIDAALAEAARGKTLEGIAVGPVVLEYIAAFINNDRTGASAIISDFYRLDGDYPDAAMLRLAELLLMDNSDDALSELKELAKDSTISPITRMSLAHVASVLGDSNLALDSFRKSGMDDIFYALWHPIHSGIRRSQEFKGFVRDAGLVDYWRSTGNWGNFCRPVGDDDFECE